MIMRTVIGLAFLLLINCTNEFNPVGAGPEVRLGNEFPVTPGTVISLSGEQLTVHFVTVSEDSRCPTDVRCVWSGNAKVGIRIVKSGLTEQAIELNTHLQPQEDDYLSYHIRLIGRLIPSPCRMASLIYRTTNQRCWLSIPHNA